MSEKKSNDKKRNWAFVLYPESATANWKDILHQTGLQCAVSPLHEDMNPDETEKKPHHHVILCYSGPTSYNVVAKLTASMNGTIPQALEQVKGYYRYLTHKDNPEKKQYDEKDIICINGFSIRDYADMTKSEIFALKQEIQKFIRRYNIIEYATLLEILEDNELLDMLDVAQSNTMLFNSYCASRRYIAEKLPPVPAHKKTPGE